LSSQAISFTGSSCSGIGGYADLGVGSGVTIRDANGTIVGVGEITDSEDVQPVCVFTFTVHDVPSGEGPYTVEISHRGKGTVTEQALADGTAALPIGNRPRRHAGSHRPKSHRQRTALMDAFPNPRQPTPSHPVSVVADQ